MEEATDKLSPALLHAKYMSLSQLIPLVENFPSEVSYDLQYISGITGTNLLLPITGVAYCPEGKIVHTNEFKILPEGDIENDEEALKHAEFVSYKQASSILKERLEEVKKELNRTNSRSLNSASKETTSAKKSLRTSSCSNPMEQRKATSVEQAIKEAEADMAAEAAEASNSNDNSDKIFEIREIEGESIGELRDMSQELKYLESLGAMDPNTASSGGIGNPDDAFIRELALISSRNSARRRGEDFHEQEEEEDIMAVLNRLEGQQRKDDASIGKGWKSGFLSNSSKSAAKDSKAVLADKVTSQEKARSSEEVQEQANRRHETSHVSFSSQPEVIPTPVIEEIVPPSAIIGSHQHRKHENARVSFNAMPTIVPPPPSDEDCGQLSPPPPLPPSPAIRAKPFSGSIIERFPPK